SAARPFLTGKRSLQDEPTAEGLRMPDDPKAGLMTPKWQLPRARPGRSTAGRGPPLRPTAPYRGARLLVACTETSTRGEQPPIRLIRNDEDSPPRRGATCPAAVEASGNAARPQPRPRGYVTRLPTPRS